MNAMIRHLALGIGFGWALQAFAQGQPPMPEPTRSWTPHIVQGPIDWSKVSGVNDQFNRKDAAMALIRTTGIGKTFSEESNQDFVEDFHFLDLKGDAASEVVYCGQTQQAGWHSYVFTSEKFQYRLAFDQPGYIHEFARAGANWRITLRQDPGKGEYFTIISKFLWLSATEKDSLLSKLYFPALTQLPQQYFESEKPMRLGRGEWLRHSPLQVDDPVIDFNGDGRPDVSGNRVVAFREGHPVSKIAEATFSGLPWSFIICPVVDPAPGHALGTPIPGITYVAGWVRSEILVP
jgi:hypothetical protein